VPGVVARIAVLERVRALGSSAAQDVRLTNDEKMRNIRLGRGILT
jgi:hypothetical protein